ncbi:nuclear transport factor 2 family protein [Dactylosporangium sp. CA-092794]|uniref:nuclear transport factor 2 family protein n=1 Tax=Dactylosporangium sp. CA-092794 TaxID=3239929 RepID=UPI003D924311
MVPTDSGSLAQAFWSSLNERDIDSAFANVAEAAQVTITPAGILGSRQHARAFFEHTIHAFPDVRFNVGKSFTTRDGVTVTELSMEGTQGAEYLGVINQEKHCDVDQVWLLETRDGLIRAITGYWCQNQLYRRLAVKRLDQVALV